MRLEELSEEHESAFLEMVADYQKNDSSTYATLYDRGRSWSSLEFGAFLKEAQSQRLDWAPGPKKTSVTRYVLLDDKNKILANGLMRFPLNDQLMREGGNLTFDVPPSQRGKGYATYVLNHMLFEAVRAGLARALVTCNADNVRAARAIVHNRGELEDTIVSQEPGNEGNRVLRFWIRFR